MNDEYYGDCNALREGRCLALTEKLCKTIGRCPFYKPKKNTAFATNLRYYRERKGMSQRVLADLCECSVSSICAYEIGTREPQIMLAKRIADILDISLDTLCG